jgi:hypothetical protein
VNFHALTSLSVLSKILLAEESLGQKLSP